MLGFIFTLFICFWTFVLGMIVAWFVVIQKLKQKEHEEHILKERPVDLLLTGDAENSDIESDNGLPSIFAYLKKSPQSSSNANSDPLSSSKRRVVVSKEVDLAIEKLIEELIEYYLFSWYKPLLQHSNPQDETEAQLLPTESVNQLKSVLKNDVWLLLSAFIDRLYSANYVHFFAISFVNRIVKHVQLLNRQKANTVLRGQKDDQGTFHSYISSQAAKGQPEGNSHLTSHSRTFSTQTSNTSISSASSTSSLSSSMSSPNLHAQQSPDRSAAETDHNSSLQVPESSQTIICHLVSHLVSVSAEHKLISRLAFFIVDILCKEALEKKSILERSNAFKLMLSKFVSVAIVSAINRVSDPAFINYQIVQLIRRRINIKDLIPVEQQPVTADLRSLSSSFSVYDLKICLSQHNFNHLMEILDHCDDMDSLKTIRVHIIEEILDVAVIEYLNKQQQSESSSVSQRHLGGSSTNSKSLSPFNSKKTLDGTTGKSSLLQQLRNTASGTLPFPGTNRETAHHKDILPATKSEADMFGALQQHFNFNANINSKVKVLQAKDLRRLINKLRYAKAICEQKIQVHKRHSALLIPECSEAINSSSTPVLSASNAYDDTKFSFDISFNSELVRSFRRSSVSGEPEVTDGGGGGTKHAGSSTVIFPSSLKPKKKNIFKFKVIMANDFCRQYFKRFLQESLFNLQSGEFHRSSRNKFRKDILICECCVYLVDVWETIQEVFEHFYHYYHAHASVQSQRAIGNRFADLHSLFAYCYHLVLQTVADSRFYYTFSQRFLHLPADLMKSLEAFLLGDVELSMLKRTSEDFSIEAFATRLDFISPEDHQQLASASLSRIDIPQYLNVFLRLEGIIFKCLCDEFYPQFLISTEYDEMLYNCTAAPGNSIDVNREVASSRWCSTVFSSFDTVDQVLNKQFAAMLATHPKPIHKIQLEGDQVDIVKNRSILLNCLEFPFFCLTSVQFIVQQRLSLKLYMKNFISQICSSNSTEVAPLFVEVAQVLSRDIVYYNDIYSHLHSMICSAYCFLHSHFTCNISDVQVHPIVQRPSSSLENKIITFVENIFSSSSSSSSVENSNSSTTASSSSNANSTGFSGGGGQLEQNYRLTFSINSTAITSPGCDHLHAFVRSQLTANFNNTWSTVHSFDGLIELFSKWMTPNLRMMAYLSHTGLFDFVHCLGRMMEPRHHLKKTVLPTSIKYYDRSKSIFSELEETDKQAYWEKLMKKLANDQIAVKRLFRQEVRDKVKLEKQKAKPQFSERLSFRKLLDKESGSSGSVSDSPETSFRNSQPSSSSAQSSEHLDKITYYLNQFFSRLTVDSDLIKTNGFLSLVQYEVCPSISQSIAESDSEKRLCLRCQLVEHLIEASSNNNSNTDDLNAFILQSLCLLSFKAGVDPQPLISPAANAEATANQDGTSTNNNPKPKLLALPQQATKLFLQNTNSLPKVAGFNQSGQLAFLHARSLLTERSSAELLDYTLSAFRHFDRQFCSACQQKLFANSGSLSGEMRSGGGGGNTSFSASSSASSSSSGRHRKGRRIKFRLFNIDTAQQSVNNQHQRQSATGSEVGTDVVASLKSGGSLTEASSSLLHENIGSSLFGGDGLEPMEPFAFGLGEEFDESNLIEPLFQLLIEVFELKGTMIRTFRRTVMFGFRLVFGQTLFSKQIKMSLEHFFTDANILQIIATLQETVRGWNEELEKSGAESGGGHNNNKGGSASNLRHRRNVSQTTSSSEPKSNVNVDKSKSSTNNTSNASAYLSDLNELLNSFSPLLDTSSFSTATGNRTADVNTAESANQPPVEASFSVSSTEPSISITTAAAPTGTAVDKAHLSAESATSSLDETTGKNETAVKDEDKDAVNIARLQILAKQLLFASVPSFLNHLFGTENTVTGLSKSFDILQYQKLNKQLIYEFLEAFLIEYYPEFKKI